MIINIESTTKIVELSGVPARVWEGKTESGISVHCFITRIALSENGNTSQFEKELQECKPPSLEVASYPLSLIL